MQYNAVQRSALPSSSAGVNSRPLAGTHSPAHNAFRPASLPASHLQLVRACITVCKRLP